MRTIHRVFASALSAAMVFASTRALASEPSICKDLTGLTCAPGTHDDGTGKILSETEIKTKLANLTTKYRKVFNAKFEAALRDPKHKFFRNEAIAALGLKDTEECSSNEPQAKASCEARLVEGLSGFSEHLALGTLKSRTDEQIIRYGRMKDMAYVTSREPFVSILQAVGADIKKESVNPETVEHIRNNVFPRVQKLIAARLGKLDVPDDVRQQMIAKIDAISFIGADCSDMKSGSSKVSEDFIPNAMYDPRTNKFAVCSGFLMQGNSEFMLVQSIAHELTHAIDPCVLSAGPVDSNKQYEPTKNPDELDAQYPIKNLVSCLRDKRSINAARAPNAMLGGYNAYATFASPYGPPGVGGGMPYPGYGMGNYTYTGPNGAGGQPMEQPDATFCGNDQIGEAVCDWMAYEVLPEYMHTHHKQLTKEQMRTGYGNVWKSSCSLLLAQAGVTDGRFQTHPRLDARINNLMLANPQIRAQMGCPEKSPSKFYCDPAVPYEPAQPADPGNGTPPRPVRRPKSAPRQKESGRW